MNDTDRSDAYQDSQQAEEPQRTYLITVDGDTLPCDLSDLDDWCAANFTDRGTLMLGFLELEPGESCHSVGHHEASWCVRRLT